MFVKKTCTILLFLLISSISMSAQNAIVESIQLDKSLSLDGLLVGKDGVLYATEGYNGTRIYSVNLEGKTSVFVQGLSGPIDMDYDNEGNIYVSTFNNKGLYKINSTGSFTRYGNVDTGPSGVCVNRKSRTVYVSHYGSGTVGNGRTIYSVDSSGNSSIFVNNLNFQAPVSLAIDDSGNVYTANISNAKVFKITPDGTTTLLLTLPTSTRNVYNIGHIAYANGYLYVTGNYSQPYVYKVSLQGDYEIIAGNGNIGSSDGSALEASFNGPNGITPSITGDTLFISELNNPSRIRMLILSSSTTSIENENKITVEFSLEQNYPNPFNPVTNIKFSIPESGETNLSIYNSLGQLVDMLINENKSAGKYSVKWNAGKLNSGVYFYVLRSGKYFDVRKTILLK